MNRAAPRCTWLRVRVGHFISASANAFIYYVIDESGGGGQDEGSGGEGIEMPSTKANSPVRDCRRASECERAPWIVDIIVV